MINLARQDFDTATIFVVILFVVLSVYSADRLLLAPVERLLARRYGTAPS
jgi:NitT/TauT family transport system permease protein/sulfonate transport system permease protein